MPLRFPHPPIIVETSARTLTLVDDRFAALVSLQMECAGAPCRVLTVDSTVSAGGEPECSVRWLAPAPGDLRMRIVNRHDEQQCLFALKRLEHKGAKGWCGKRVNDISLLGPRDAMWIVRDKATGCSMVVKPVEGKDGELVKDGEENLVRSRFSLTVAPAPWGTSANWRHSSWTATGPALPRDDSEDEDEHDSTVRECGCVGGYECYCELFDDEDYSEIDSDEQLDDEDLSEMDSDKLEEEEEPSEESEASGGESDSDAMDVVDPGAATPGRPAPADPAVAMEASDAAEAADGAPSADAPMDLAEGAPAARVPAPACPEPAAPAAVMDAAHVAEDEGPAAEPADSVAVILKRLAGEEDITVRVAPTATLEELRTAVQAKAGLPADRLVLSLPDGRVLKDGRLVEFGIKDFSEVMLLVRKDTGGTMQVFVKDLGNKTVTLSVTPDTTVLAVKEMLEVKLGIAAADLRVLFAGKQMEEKSTLADYNIQKGSTLQIAIELRGGGGCYDLPGPEGLALQTAVQRSVGWVDPDLGNLVSTVVVPGRELPGPSTFTVAVEVLPGRAAPTLFFEILVEPSSCLDEDDEPSAA